MAVLHSARWLVPVLGVPLRDGALLETGGVITAVGPRSELARLDHDQERHTDGVIIPGLVNAHTHLQYSGMANLGRGTFAGFHDWAPQFQRLFTDPDNDWYAAAVEGVRSAVASGTTAFADVVTSVEALPVLRRTGVRGVAYWEVMAWSTAGWIERGRELNAQLLAEHRDLDLGISPHAPYSLDEQVISDLTTLSHELGVRRHIHLAESTMELEFIASGTGPQAATLHRWGLSDFALLQRGGSGLGPVAYVDKLGGLGPDCHIAHGIYVTAQERALLRRHRTAVALCPRSNAVIGLDEPPVADYLTEHNLLAVGTDSLASAPSLDLLADVAVLAGAARRQGYIGTDLHARLLEAATLGGARALGLDRGSVPIGALAAGYAADYAVLDIAAAGAAELLSRIVEEGAGTARTTVIGGHQLTLDSCPP